MTTSSLLLKLERKAHSGDNEFGLFDVEEFGPFGSFTSVVSLEVDIEAGCGLLPFKFFSFQNPAGFITLVDVIRALKWEFINKINMHVAITKAMIGLR
jgi:hypothetical protein